MWSLQAEVAESLWWPGCYLHIVKENALCYVNIQHATQLTFLKSFELAEETRLRERLLILPHESYLYNPKRENRERGDMS